MIGSTRDMYRNYDKSDAKTFCTNCLQTLIITRVKKKGGMSV